MWTEKEKLEEKWRDHQLKYAQKSPISLRRDDVQQFSHRTFDDLQTMIHKLSLILSRESQEWALGRPGESGDPVKIDHYARRFIAIYEEILKWAAEIRGASVPADCRRLLELAAQFNDLPLSAIRNFIDRFVADFTDLPARIERGEKIDIALTLKVDLDSALIDEFLAECRKIVTSIRHN